MWVGSVCCEVWPCYGHGGLGYCPVVAVYWLCVSFRCWWLTRCTWPVHSLFRTASLSTGSLTPGFHRSGCFVFHFPSCFFFVAHRQHALIPFTPSTHLQALLTRHWLSHSIHSCCFFSSQFCCILSVFIAIDFICFTLESTLCTIWLLEGAI